MKIVQYIDDGNWWSDPSIFKDRLEITVHAAQVSGIVWAKVKFTIYIWRVGVFMHALLIQNIEHGFKSEQHDFSNSQLKVLLGFFHR